jgi:hypothetical protein
MLLSFFHLSFPAPTTFKNGKYKFIFGSGGGCHEMMKNIMGWVKLSKKWQNSASIISINIALLAPIKLFLTGANLMNLINCFCPPKRVPNGEHRNVLNEFACMLFF